MGRETNSPASFPPDIYASALKIASSNHWHQQPVLWAWLARHWAALYFFLARRSRHIWARGLLCGPEPAPWTGQPPGRSQGRLPPPGPHPLRSPGSQPPSSGVLPGAQAERVRPWLPLDNLRLRRRLHTGSRVALLFLRKQSGLERCKEPAFRAWWDHSGYSRPLFWASGVWG